MSEFDKKVHKRHPKTGQIIGKNPYALVLTKSADGDDAEAVFERPPGSGIFYAPNGALLEKKSEAGLKRQKAAEAELAQKRAYENLSPAEKKKADIDKALKFLEEQGIKVPAASAPNGAKPQGGA